MIDNNQKIKLVFTFIAAALLVFMLNIVTSKEQAKEYVTGNYYDSNHGVKVNQQSLFAALYGNTNRNANDCAVKMSMSSNPLFAGKYVWMVDGQTINKGDLTRKEGVDYYTDIFNDGDYIIAPSTLEFINANVIEYEEGVITIRAYVGEKYIIQWEDIQCWWCHIDKDDPRTHTVKIGAGGKYPTCIEGAVIGQAKEETKVTFYEVTDDGNTNVISIDDFYFR